MKHILAGIIGDRQRQIMHSVVDEISANPGEEYALQLMPIVNVPASILYNERLSGMGGLAGEREYGEKGKAVNGGSSGVRPYQPGSYQEHIIFGERDILFLRALGSLGDAGVTGLNDNQLNRLSRDAMKLQLRLKNRINKLIWDALFVGTYVWNGQTFSFDIPGGNAITATTDWSVAATGKPLSDLWTIQMTNAKLLKYKIKEFVMNPVTASYALKTAELQAIIVNNSSAAGDLNALAKIQFPGLAPIKICKDGYQDESLSAGEIVLGNYTFFVPDDKVLVIPDFGGTMYGMFGEFNMAENINDPSATLDRKAVGIYTFVDEKGLEQRENPFVKVVAGFNGGPNLQRSNDVFVISV